MHFQLHLAEYQMLTNRATYLMTVAYGLWTLFAIFLTILFSLWNVFLNYHFHLIWGGLIVLQVVTFLSGYLTTEIYDIALYIETELRDLVVKIAGEGSFWSNEKYLKGLRTDFFWVNKEIFIPAVTLVLIMLIFLIGIFQMTGWDYFMGFISISGCVYNILIAKRLITKRKKFSSYLSM